VKWEDVQYDQNEKKNAELNTKIDLNELNMKKICI
jgi:hypothetical protein